jgi:hypothetical protein
MVGGDSGLADKEAVEALCRGIECPAFVVQSRTPRGRPDGYAYGGACPRQSSPVTSNEQM